ncbi:TPA: hypothetical protein ACH7CW_003832 [Escherichia coli]
MAKFQRAIIFLAMLSASHLSHASVIAAGAAATAATTAAVNASIASEQARIFINIALSRHLPLP